MDSEKARWRFRELFRAHRSRGEVRPLGQYQRFFPGHDSTIASEFGHLEQPQATPHGRSGAAAAAAAAPEEKAGAPAAHAPATAREPASRGPVRSDPARPATSHGSPVPHASPAPHRSPAPHGSPAPQGSPTPLGAPTPQGPSTPDPPPADDANAPDAVERLLQRLRPDARVRYRRDAPIGRGAMGTVHLVTDERLERPLAMKVIREDLARSVDQSIQAGTWPRRTPTLVRRFVDEARITARLDHPGIPPVHDFGLTADGELYFTMKLVDGRGLESVLASARQGNADWPLSRLVQLVVKVCETLAYAHAKGVLHRDLKPANIMVGSFGEVYVMDWGLAKQAAVVVGAEGGEASPNLTAKGVILGSPPYMPPEQAFGQIDKLTERSDVYAVGCLLYEILTGHAPYTHPGGADNKLAVVKAVRTGPPPRPQELAPTAPEELCAVAVKAMARDPADRYESALDLARDLNAFLEGRVVTAHSTGTVAEFRKWLGRNRALTATAFAASVILIGGAVVRTLQAERAAEEILTQRNLAVAAERRANTERARAEGLRLSAVASAAVEEDPTLALLLAAEGARRAPGRDADVALYQALARHHETAHMAGHDGYVLQAIALAEGRRILTTGRDPVAIVWDVAAARPVHTLDTGADEIRCATVSPAADRAALVTDRGEVQIWDLAQGLRILAGGRGDVRLAAWSRDGSRILVTTDGDPALLHASTLAADVELRGHEGSVPEAVFVLGGRGIATQGMDGTVRVWDAATGRQIAEGSSESRSDDLPTALLTDGGGTRLVCVGVGVTFWDPAALRPVARIDGDGCALSADGRTAVVWKGHSRGRRRSNFVMVLDPATGDEIARYETSPPFGEAVLSADGGTMAVTGGGFAIRVLLTATGERVADLAGHTYRVSSMAFTKDAARLISTSNDTTARVWAIGQHGSSRLLPRRAGEDGGETLAVSPDGHRAVTRLPGDELPRLVDARNGRDVGPLDGGGPVVGAVFGPRGLLLTRHADDDEDIPEWVVRDAETGGRRGSFHGAGETPAMAARVDVVAIRDGGSVAVRSLLDSEILRVVECPQHLAGVALSPDGSTLATADGQDRTVTLWDVASGSTRQVLSGHSGTVLEVAFSEVGDLLASTAVDASVRIWDLQTGESVGVVRGLPMEHLFLEWHPAAAKLAVTTASSAYVVEARGAMVTAVLGGHEARVRRARFSSTGHDLVTWDGDGVVLRRSLTPLPQAEAAIPRSLTLAERERFAVGDEDEREAELERRVAASHAPQEVARWIERCTERGETERAEAAARRLIELRPLRLAGHLALARCLAARGGAEDAGRALDALTVASDCHDATRAAIEGDERLAPLRADPRYPAVLALFPTSKLVK